MKESFVENGIVLNAVEAGNVETVNYLAKNSKINPDIKPLALEIARKRGHREIVSRLKAYNVESSQPFDFNGCSDELLASYAKLANLPGTITKRDTIIEKLQEKNFVPPSEN